MITNFLQITTLFNEKIKRKVAKGNRMEQNDKRIL